MKITIGYLLYKHKIYAFLDNLQHNKENCFMNLKSKIPQCP